jgi:hypothetical protein
MNRAVGFETTEVIGQGGQNSSTLVGKLGYEKLSVDRQQIHLDYGNRQVTVRDFSENRFDGLDALGEIVFADFSEGDFLSGTSNAASGVLASQSMRAQNFGLLEARTQSGSAAEYEIGLVDYLFMLDGNWSSRR